MQTLLSHNKMETQQNQMHTKVSVYHAFTHNIIGSKDGMVQLEDDFIDGEYTPFQNPLPLGELTQNTPAEPPAKKKKKGMYWNEVLYTCF